ncbi:MAG: RDD family protein, partial [Actinomycetota bacterium]
MTASRTTPPEEVDSLEGHYAGPVTRLLAYLADAFFIGTSYGFILSGVYWVYNVIADANAQPPTDEGVWAVLGAALGLMAWVFVYNGVCWSVWWKTPGKALLGLRVVERDGADLTGRTAWKRAFFYPVSFLFPPLGFAGIVVGAERRSWHDALAGTTVVYDWNA